MTEIFRNATCTRRLGFCGTRAEEINKFDWAHLASLFFRTHEDSRIHMCFSNLQSKFTESKKPSTRIILRKQWRRVKPHKHSRLWNFWSQSRRLYRKILTKIEVVPVKTCENTSHFSCKSRVLHAFWCVRLRRYTTRRGSVILTILLLQTVCRQICVWRWKYYLYSDQEFLYKKKMIFCFFNGRDLGVFGTN